jgi:hypothetical protein
MVVVIRPTHPGPSLDSGGGGGGGDKADSPKKFPSPYHMSNPAEKKKAKVSLARLAKLTAVVLAN